MMTPSKIAIMTVILMVLSAVSSYRQAYKFERSKWCRHIHDTHEKVLECKANPDWE